MYSYSIFFYAIIGVAGDKKIPLQHRFMIILYILYISLIK